MHVPPRPACGLLAGLACLPARATPRVREPMPRPGRCPLLTRWRRLGGAISIAAMSKRLEYWKAPETVRLAVGWLALLMGIKGVEKVFSGLFLFNGKQEVGFG